MKLLSSLLFFFVSVAADAQTLAISHSTFPGGGGTSASSQYTVCGTIGQPGTGVSTGGSYGLESGFWSAFIVIQSDAAPMLTFTRSGNNLILSWPATCTGFTLQEATNLRQPDWATNATAPTTNNGVISVTLSMTGGLRFFRLVK